MDKTINYIKSDVWRYYGKCSLLSFIFYYFRDPVIRWHVAFRLRKSKGIVKLVGICLWLLNRSKKTISIPSETEVGYGLYIGHGGPVIVNPTAKIGNNVNLSPFTVIGSNKGKAATIGDFTYIGPNCSIIESVNIGRNVTIGAGSVVTKNIPDNATACGNYAKVIHFNNPGRYTLNNRWTSFDE